MVHSSTSDDLLPTLTPARRAPRRLAEFQRFPGRVQSRSAQATMNEENGGKWAVARRLAKGGRNVGTVIGFHIDLPGCSVVGYDERNNDQESHRQTHRTNQYHRSAQLSEKYEIVGFLDDNLSLAGSVAFGIPVLDRQRHGR